MTETIGIDAQRPDEALVRRAVDVMARGGLVVFPTETFYGLGADPWNASAVGALFAAKGRPVNAPILLLLASKDQVLSAASSIPRAFEILADAFWPGPLTLVLPARSDLPGALTAGASGIGLRVSGLPLARDLPRALGRPITGTSANESGRPPAVTAEAVRNAMGNGWDRVDLLLNGGATAGESPSTVVDPTYDPPKLIREGAIPFDRVLASLRE